jgi:selenocysteine lyase/cysteine desulfurase
MLYASRDAQKQMKSLGHYFNPTTTLKDKIGLAGGLYELAQSIPEVVKYLNETQDWHQVIDHESHLQSTLLEYLNSRPEITIRGDPNGDPKLRVPTVSFSVDKWSPREFVETVENQSNFGFRWGGFYSNRLICGLLNLPAEGVVRISMVHYNTRELTNPNDAIYY